MNTTIFSDSQLHLAEEAVPTGWDVLTISDPLATAPAKLDPTRPAVKQLVLQARTVRTIAKPEPELSPMQRLMASIKPRNQDKQEFQSLVDTVITGRSA